MELDVDSLARVAFHDKRYHHTVYPSIDLKSEAHPFRLRDVALAHPFTHPITNVSRISQGCVSVAQLRLLFRKLQLKLEPLHRSRTISPKVLIMATTTDAKKLSDALLSFALEGKFPEDITSLPPVSGTDLEPAIQALDKAKQDLEVGQPGDHIAMARGKY